MFTWICPKCGKENDVANKTCSNCAVPEVTAADPPILPASSASSSDLPAATPAPNPQTQPQTQPQPQALPRPTASRNSLEVRPIHLLWFAVVMVLAIGMAVWISQPELLSLESVEDLEEETVETFARGVQGPLEVAGVRPYYTDDYQTKVKAFVVNHSDQAQSGALRVHLRHQQAMDNAPPLASFDVITSEPLAGHGALEIDTDLEAMGSLQSLPPWNEIRVDVESK